MRGKRIQKRTKPIMTNRSDHVRLRRVSPPVWIVRAHRRRHIKMEQMLIKVISIANSVVDSQVPLAGTVMLRKV